MILDDLIKQASSETQIINNEQQVNNLMSTFTNFMANQNVDVNIKQKIYLDTVKQLGVYNETQDNYEKPDKQNTFVDPKDIIKQLLTEQNAIKIKKEIKIYHSQNNALTTVIENNSNFRFLNQSQTLKSQDQNKCSFELFSIITEKMFFDEIDHFDNARKKYNISSDMNFEDTDLLNAEWDYIEPDAQYDTLKSFTYFIEPEKMHDVLQNVCNKFNIPIKQDIISQETI